MSSTTGGGRIYLSLLGRRHVLAPFGASVLARLPIPMAPIGIVLLVQHARSSYGLAGLVTGGYAVGAAVGSPLLGRAMDRSGQARVILPAALVSAGVLAVLAVCTNSGAPVGLLVVLAAVSGASYPPFSAAMRVAWRFVLDDEGEQQAGYAADAAAVEVSYIAGPLLLSLFLVVTAPVAPLIITAGLLVAGAVGYSLTAPARHRPRPREHATRRGPRAPALLRNTATAAVLVVGVCLAVGFGSIDTSLVATARSVLHDQGQLGFLFAPLAGGSAIGGLTYGTLAGHAREHRRIPVLMSMFGIGVIVLAVLLSAGRPSWWVLVPTLLVAGLAISPTLIILQNLLDVFAPLERRNEAQAWLATSFTAGSAAGTAIAGELIDALGVSASMAGAGVAAFAAGSVALLAGPKWRADAADRALLADA